MVQTIFRIKVFTKCKDMWESKSKKKKKYVIVKHRLSIQLQCKITSAQFNEFIQIIFYLNFIFPEEFKY